MATEDEAKYFSSPEEAVTIVTKLIGDKDWPGLARYYDLTESDVAPEELGSGRFFLVDEGEYVGPPLAGPKVKRPFQPGFKYDRHAAGPGSKVKVYVSISIDQGDAVVLEGSGAFLLKKTPMGYRLLPEDTDAF